jgi:hypothetical protein
MQLNGSQLMDEELIPFGIDAETGRPLPSIDLSAERIAERVAVPPEEDKATAQRTIQLKSFGPITGIDEENLASAGWGIMFASSDPEADAIEAALKPLLERREHQAGEFYKVFKKESGYKLGDTAVKWLGRQGNKPGLDLVDPANGVPYYLMIVGSPDTIPIQFQYQLDIYWAVGRLHFDNVDDYARYARSIVAYETVGNSRQRKQLAIFAPRHDFDRATQLFHDNVAQRFFDGAGVAPPLGKNQGFTLQGVMGEAATKQGFADLLSGRRDAGVPAMLLSGSHGMVFGMDDARQGDCQGALVCQNWPGYGAIGEREWFAAGDLSGDAKLHGMICFLFACYGGGYGTIDSFRDGPGGRARQIARKAAIARLPQAMLAHPGGSALAVIAHIDRAWAYTFQTLNGGPQTQGFREVLTCLMLGRSVGSSTDRFNTRWAALSTELSDALRDGVTEEVARRLARLWIARDDARNYIVLGDPAVKLRVSELVS